MTGVRITRGSDYSRAGSSDLAAAAGIQTSRDHNRGARLRFRDRGAQTISAWLPGDACPGDRGTDREQTAPRPGTTPWHPLTDEEAAQESHQIRQGAEAAQDLNPNLSDSKIHGINDDRSPSVRRQGPSRHGSPPRLLQDLPAPRPLRPHCPLHPEACSTPHPAWTHAGCPSSGVGSRHGTEAEAPQAAGARPEPGLRAGATTCQAEARVSAPGASPPPGVGVRDTVSGAEGGVSPPRFS